MRGDAIEQFPDAVRRAIREHRMIDSTTDRHPLTKQAKALFEPPVRRYAGIVIDVVYDHFLALDWQTYSAMSLPAYTSLVEQTLDQHRELLPPQMHRFVDFIRREQVLAGNLQRAEIELTLKRLSMRSDRMRPLAQAGEALWANADQLKNLFDDFFPQLIAQVDHWRLEQQQ